jgi:large subunit ribosomal protein L21
MFAVVSTGGKQYKVEKDLIFKVEKLNVKEGDKIKLDVLMIDDNGAIVTGNPIKDSYVETEVLGDGKGKKLFIYKYKAKKNQRNKIGHRQPFTTLKVLNIVKA